jgi:multidrug efflux system membrane fusion protein
VDTLKNVVVAPTEAIQRGPDGAYVYVVGADNTVKMRPVKIARQDEKQAVIAEGVTAGEKLVTTGFGRLKDGASVSVSDSNGKPPAADGATKRHHRSGADKAAHIADDHQTESASAAAAPLITGSNTERTQTAASTRVGEPHNGSRRHHRKDNGASP